MKTTRTVVQEPGGITRTTTITEYISYNGSGADDRLRDEFDERSGLRNGFDGGSRLRDDYGGGSRFRDDIGKGSRPRNDFSAGNRRNDDGFGSSNRRVDGSGGDRQSRPGRAAKYESKPKSPSGQSKSPSRPPARQKSPSRPQAKLEGKTYDEIKAQCLREKRLFEDPDFPANDSSIAARRPSRSFEWKRPGELTSDPQLFVGGASRLDIKQGNLGNCWLLAAISSLTLYQDLMDQVIPKDQGFSAKEGYCGMFRFKFWVFGKWKEIIIDDYLPTTKGRLVFMHSPDNNEFWAALMEKAYAKMSGSYENLKGGSSSEAMVDFTGGITEVFDLTQNQNEHLYSIMIKAIERESMMGCAIDQQNMGTEAELANGLIVGHAYSVTDAKTVDMQAGKGASNVELVRVRNPWGNEREWKGPWCDKSKEWTMISARERSKLGQINSDDGEFWMSFDDFVKNYSKLEICHISLDSAESKGKKKWEMTAHEGSWKKRFNAGGCKNYRDTFWTNPQYRVTVVNADEGNTNTGTLIVALLQKDRRSRGAAESQLLVIGYGIYQLQDPNCGPLEQNFFKRNKAVAKCPQFIDMREITGRHKLAPGTYCIIPSTFEPGEEGDFLLRVFTEKPIASNEIDEETKMSTTEAKAPAQTHAEAEDMKAMFRKIAGDDGVVDAKELQSILNTVYMNEFPFDGFTIRTCRSLLATKDIIVPENSTTMS